MLYPAAGGSDDWALGGAGIPYSYTIGRAYTVIRILAIYKACHVTKQLDEFDTGLPITNSDLECSFLVGQLSINSWKKL